MKPFRELPIGSFFCWKINSLIYEKESLNEVRCIDPNVGRQWIVENLDELTKPFVFTSVNIEPIDEWAEELIIEV